MVWAHTTVIDRILSLIDSRSAAISQELAALSSFAVLEECVTNFNLFVRPLLR